MTENKRIYMTIDEVIYCLKAESERYPEVCEECPLYRKVGCDHCYDDAADIAIKALEEIQRYRAISTPEECRTAVERMKAASTNESMVTVGLYFEIHDADLYGGKGTVGYASTNADSKVSALAKADIGNYVESQRQAFAEMLKVDVEKVKVISRTEYEENTEEEDECNFDWSE